MRKRNGDYKYHLNVKITDKEKRAIEQFADQYSEEISFSQAARKLIIRGLEVDSR